MTFASQPNFASLDEVNATISMSTGITGLTSWYTNSVLPVEFLNKTISFVNSNGGSGTRTFDENGIVRGTGNADTVAIYYYDATTGSLEIDNGVATTTITLDTNDLTDLTDLPIGEIDYNDNVILDISSVTTTWTFDGFDAATYFTGTKYYVSESGAIGERTFNVDGNYTGTVEINGTPTSVSGTYTTSGGVLTLNRTVPSAVTLVLTHVENTVGAGEIFDISINGGTSTITFNYDTAAERDDASPLTTAGNMVEGMVLRDLGAWDGEYELYTITLAGTNLTETASTIDENGTFNVDINESDLILTSGGWIDYSTYIASNNYTIVNGNVIFDDGEMVRIVDDLNLSNPTTADEIAAVTKLNELVPGDTNITFTSGALAYTMEFKSVEKYEVWGMATNCSDWNSTTNSCNVTPTSFDTIVDFLISGTTIAGTEVNGTWIGVDVQRDGSGNPLDSTGIISTISEGMYGNLYINNTTIVGTWKVIDLPYSAGLAIVLSGNSGLENYFDNSDNLLAVVNGKVYQGEMTQLSTDFVTEDFVIFNMAAFDNIQTAFEDYYPVP